MAIPPGYADVSIRLTNSAMQRPAFITFGIDPSGTNPDSIAGEVYGSFTTAGAFFSRLDSGVTIGPVTVRLGQDGGEALIGVSDVTSAGGATLASPPPNVAVLVHKRTNRGGRRGRGRWFLPWYLTETDVDEAGQILTAAVTPIQAALTLTLNNLSAQGNPMVILHEPGLTSAGVPDVVHTLTVDRLVATQRRRLGR